MESNDTIMDRCEFGHRRERYVWADWAICRTCLSMALLHGVEFERERRRALREGGDPEPVCPTCSEIGTRSGKEACG